MVQFENQVALVTGAGRGIGKAIALDLAQAGADIVFTNRTKSLAEETRAEIEALGRKCLAVQADVTEPEAVEGMVAQALEQFSTIDILVNNAGITSDQLFMRMTLENWRKVMSVNLDGMFHVTRAVIKTMVKQRRGRIINITSVVGFTGNPGQVNYSSAKSAVVGFTKSIARELGSRNITCNAVAPGFVDTDMTRVLNESQRKAIMDQIPLGRMGTVEEIAKAVRFIASEDAGYISGTVIHVNGGMF
ncbi:MAG: 3-oxoacyl-[acyl-carrier-protein] reductase [SAR324 cluster bacterium]|nr:3-oxoacyl-[acyl-carrier-protein] reductase [SAR324 cluster bacterium]MCZ6843285.1 3-oxoacyl-[acyl-carrier-protein] reductase [SAR324 cluster bacterium]